MRRGRTATRRRGQLKHAEERVTDRGHTSKGFGAHRRLSVDRRVGIPGFGRGDRDRSLDGTSAGVRILPHRTAPAANIPGGETSRSDGERRTTGRTPGEEKERDIQAGIPRSRDGAVVEVSVHDAKNRPG